MKQTVLEVAVLLQLCIVSTKKFAAFPLASESYEKLSFSSSQPITRVIRTQGDVSVPHS